MNVSCKKASELLARRQDGAPLTLRQRIALRFHLTLCAMCRQYQRQFELLNRICRQYLRACEKHAPADDKKLSPQCKQRIQGIIDKEQD